MTTQLRSVHLPRSTVLVAALAAFALVFAACGDDDDETPTATATQAAASPTSGLTTPEGTPAATTSPEADSLVKVASTSKGDALTDEAGKTLYTFDNDTTAGKSFCNGGCATAWPPLVTTEATAPSGVAGASGAFTIITRDDGASQIAYDGKPLYTYAGDTAAGDVAGDGLSGVWHIATP